KKKIYPTGTILLNTRAHIISLKDYFECGSSGRMINVTYPPYEAPDPFHIPSAKEKHSSLGLIIAIVVGVLFLLVVIALIVYFCIADKKQKKQRKHRESKDKAKAISTKPSGSKNKVSSARKESVGTSKQSVQS